MPASYRFSITERIDINSIPNLDWKLSREFGYLPVKEIESNSFSEVTQIIRLNSISRESIEYRFRSINLLFMSNGCDKFGFPIVVEIEGIESVGYLEVFSDKTALIDLVNKDLVTKVIQLIGGEVIGERKFIRISSIQ